MPSSTPHQKFYFYHLPTRGRAGIKHRDAWYVSNVSIIFDCSMLLYLLFSEILGFIIHFYIIFGTNLLTGGPAQICCFMPISVFWRKGISDGVQTERNQLEKLFLEGHTPDALGPHVRRYGSCPRGWGVRPLPRGAPVAPLTYFLHPYISSYPKTSRMDNRSGVPPPEASVATKNQSRPVPAPCLRGNPSPVAIFIILALSMTRRE